MSRRISRKELHELVWSAPASQLAPTFGVSDVTLKKACSKAHVPIPPAGYWARKPERRFRAAIPLPPRPPGLSDEIAIPADPYWGARAPLSDEEIVSWDPVPPEFEESLEQVAARVEKLVRKVSSPRDLGMPHPVVARFLRQDEVRRERQRASSFPMAWDSPKFDSPSERRRLRLLSGILVGLTQAGCSVPADGGDSGDVRATVGRQVVRVLTGPAQPAAKKEAGTKQARLRIELRAGYYDDPDAVTWDDGSQPLESVLRQVVVAAVMMGEAQHRRERQRDYARHVERKATLLEAIRKRAEEAVRKEQHRLAELERSRVAKLLAQAQDLQAARQIRRFVEEATAAIIGSGQLPAEADLDRWRQWALDAADRLDPVRNGSFRHTILGQATSDDIGPTLAE